jgi:hypothetical protein
MDMIRATKEEVICDIKAVTHYTDEDFEGKTYKQLCAMRARIFTAIDMYYKEIVRYFREHPEERTMSNQDLKLLNYNELADLRRELGLARKRVTKVSEDSELVKKARELVARKEVRELARDIIVSEDQYETQECFLYAEEIRELGYADYTRNQLLRMGIIPLDIEESHLKK